MHAPFQMPGGSLLRVGRDVVMMLGGGISVLTGVRGMLSRRGGEGSCVIGVGVGWRGPGVVGGRGMEGKGTSNGIEALGVGLCIWKESEITVIGLLEDCIVGMCVRMLCWAGRKRRFGGGC